METQPPLCEKKFIHDRSGIDTSRPFRSVKEAVAVLDKRFLAGDIYYSPKPYTIPKQDASRKPLPPLSSNILKQPSNDEVDMVNTLKKLEAELEETKKELKTLKERESETEVAVASLNAELHKNMSKIAKAEATAAGKAVATRALFVQGGYGEDYGILEGAEMRRESLVRMERSTSLGQILSLGEKETFFGGKKKQRGFLKKKPIIPLVGQSSRFLTSLVMKQEDSKNTGARFSEVEASFSLAEVFFFSLVAQNSFVLTPSSEPSIPAQNEPESFAPKPSTVPDHSSSPLHFETPAVAAVEIETPYQSSIPPQASSPPRPSLEPNMLSLIMGKLESMSSNITDFQQEVRNRLASLESKVTYLRAENKAKHEANEGRLEELSIEVDIIKNEVDSTTSLIERKATDAVVISYSFRKPISSVCIHLQQQHTFSSTSFETFRNSEPPSIADRAEEFLYTCNSRSLIEGVCVHSPIIKLGLQDHLFLNNNLLSLYAKCFGVEPARHLFNGMAYKDVVSWSGIISAYVRNGNHVEALELFDLMVISGSVPNEFTFSSVLRSCSSLGEFDRGTCTHAQIVKHGFEPNPVLGSALVNFYSKCGRFVEASEIFASMNDGDIVSWTAMISSFVQSHKGCQALRLYSRMLRAGILPNEFTFVKLLAASSFLDLVYGKLVHAHVIIWGAELNLVLKTALANMYSKFHRMGDTLKISNQTPECDVLLWTVFVSGFSQNLDFKEAIAAFRDMMISGVTPNNFTYAGILNACSSIPSLELGEQIHSRVIIVGLGHDISVGNALVDMYMKCSPMVGDALQTFGGIISPNVISWTSLICGFARRGLEHEAFQSFAEMQAVGLQPNSFTLSGILKGCGTFKYLCQARKIHAYICKTKAYSDIIVGNALVDVYARMGMVDDAWHVISMMSYRDVITYTSLATGINEMGHHKVTLNIISHMQDDGVKMDGFSLASFLSASASLAAMEPGKQLHCYSVKYGLSCWISVSNGLVDLYGKCGCIHDAHKAFMEIPKPNVVSWNGLISGLASNGHFSSSLSSFEDMRLAEVQPDNITFLIVLYACSHGGLVDLGLEYFQYMSGAYGIAPQLDHYVCLVDLLGRAGRLEEAMGVMKTMPFRPDALIYKTLLGSCRMHGNVVMGEDMARHALELDPSDPAIYVLLANIYDNTGRPDLGESIRMTMRGRGLKKNPGHSWMERNDKVHLFMAGD
ncbi:hypothetical protein HHK36_030356 [Tetracentron sinense]|uniref:Pentatricopeptide repeat-containing protein n=1 Tax=Tetracentron sinense TaxID=13715 RepID=A0A834Y9H5_TETSI|nr:hypothetical protein HHK36_030356 [Tetracentron sinense]